MFPIMTTGGGQCFGFPNVCLTQTGPVQVPLPWPNFAMCSDGEGAQHVTIKNAAVLRKGDCQARSSKGAPPNAVKGLIAMATNGSAEVDQGWSKVKVEGKEVGYLTARVKIDGGSPPYNQPATGLHFNICQSEAWVIAIPPPFPNRGIDPLADAAQLLRCAPSLVTDMADLKKQGWQIKYRPGDASDCNWQPPPPTIYISQAFAWSTPGDLVGILAHEVGHAMDGQPPYQAYSGMPKYDFVTKNTMGLLDSEGAAVLNNVDVNKQVQHECPGNSIVVGFDEDGKMTQIANDSSLTPQQKRDAVALQMMSKFPGGKDKNYWESYSGHYEEFWAKTFGNLETMP